MQPFVPPIFGENAPDPAPINDSDGAPRRGIRWWAVLALIAGTLMVVLASYLLTAGLLDARGESDSMLAVAMALLAGAASLGLIGLAQQLTGFLTAERASEGASPDYYTVSPDNTPPSDLAQSLYRQREETAHLLAVLESIPEGVVVQDLEGRVLLINDAARELLGSQRAFRAARLHELTEAIRTTLGPALAPGIYALGNPARVPFEGKMLQAQAAALLSRKGARLGTVVLVRDVTAEVERERARAGLLDQLSEQVAAPGAALDYPSLDELAREVTRNTRTVQQVIAALQDLSTFEPRDLATEQRPLGLNELLQDTAREWQPLAQAAGIRLRVKFASRGHYVLGDERRLRWALGNVLDNAIRYSPPNTAILMSARARLREPAIAEIDIQDQGYGIDADELSSVFTRFYRGTPRDAHGTAIHRPGTGQGLFIAQRVIKAHGGVIAIASQPQRGTNVSMSLPLTAPVVLELPEADDTVRRPGIVDPVEVDLDDTSDIPVISLLPIDREVDML